jgi:hypothetical protein
MGTTPRIPTGLGIDQNHGHVQPNGAYHYHGLPTLLIARLSGGDQKMTHVGWAADGYPVYAVYAYADPADPKSALKAMKSSDRLKTVERGGDGQTSPTGKPDGSFGLDFEYVAGHGDLDEFGGRTGVTPEFPQGTHHRCADRGVPLHPAEAQGHAWIRRSTRPAWIRTRTSAAEGGPGASGPKGGKKGKKGPPPFGPPQKRRQGRDVITITSVRRARRCATKTR